MEEWCFFEVVSMLERCSSFGFCSAQINSSLVFFLLSFQVHEKSILLALLPSSLLIPHHPHTVAWFQLLALFSLYPLLAKDGLVLATWALGALYTTLAFSLPSPSSSSSSNRGKLSRMAKIVVSLYFPLPECFCVAEPKQRKLRCQFRFANF